MSLVKSVAGFLISSLFIISLYLTISSYTIGSILQKENIKDFVKAQIRGETATQTCEDFCSSEANYRNCEDYCNYLEGDLKEACIFACRSNITESPEAKQICMNECLSKSNETEAYVYNTIDEIYDKKIIGDLSINNIMPIFKNTILLIVLCLILGISMFFVSDKPLSKLGNNLIVVSISLLSVAIIPIFIISPDIPVIKLVSDYIQESLYSQLIVGVILLVAGIIFIIIGKKVKWKKKNDDKEVKKGK